MWHVTENTPGPYPRHETHAQNAPANTAVNRRPRSHLAFGVPPMEPHIGTSAEHVVRRTVETVHPKQTHATPLTTIPEPPHALLPDVGTQSRMNPPPRSSTSHARANNGARAPAVRPLSGDRAAAVSRPPPPVSARRHAGLPPPPRSGRRLCARDRRARDGPPSRARGSARETSAHRRSARRLR